MIFGRGDFVEWLNIKGLSDLFCKASGMTFSPSKSCFRFWGLEENLLVRISELFLIKGESLDVGVSYLGFYLKPNCYLRLDWLWLVRKVQRRISRWLSKWLSLGGRKTLILSVLQAIPVYWFLLFRVPSGILFALRQLFFHFLWRGTSENFRFHLENWSFLSPPISWGGWGFKQLGIFNLSLCAKILR